MKLWLKIVITLVINIICALLIVVIGGVGERIAEHHTPPEIDVETWGNFVTKILSLSIVLVAVVYFIYITVLHKLIRVDSYQKIFKLRRPWLLGFIILFASQIIVGTMVGLSMIPRRDFVTVVTIIGYSGLLAIIGTILYWIFSLVYSPDKVKYTPPLRYQAVTAYRDIRGGKK